MHHVSCFRSLADRLQPSQKGMNFYTIDPGFDAEAREIEEWTNQAPEPKAMEWKVDFAQ